MATSPYLSRPLLPRTLYEIIFSKEKILTPSPLLPNQAAPVMGYYPSKSSNKQKTPFHISLLRARRFENVMPG